MAEAHRKNWRDLCVWLPMPANNKTGTSGLIRFISARTGIPWKHAGVDRSAEIALRSRRKEGTLNAQPCKYPIGKS
jgi:hypothetical protein